MMQAIAFVAAAAAQDDRWFSTQSEYCCKGGFSADRVIAAARNRARTDTARIKWYLFSDRLADQFGEGGASDQSWEQKQDKFLKDAADRHRFALYLKTPKGEAIDFWDGAQRSFERRVLSGGNPFFLPGGAELISMRWGSEWHTFSVYCRVRDTGTQEQGRQLLAELSELIGKEWPIEVLWADNPWSFVDSIHLHVHSAPWLGWSGPPPRAGPLSPHRCTLEPNSGKVDCHGLPPH